ncbi:MAG: glycosyltransferase [Fidelibacterota bacterium]|nr:MAG: glycosyltransferase [Candidatus Neomarinimicrobiota bacterium]
MTLSVIVVSYNVREFVSQCLLSLSRCRFDGTVEVILVDNNSSDGTVEMVPRRFPQVRLIKNRRNVGYAAALNQGLTASTGEMILFLNPDTILEEQTLQVLVDYLQEHPQVGCVGPKILNSDGSFQLASRRSFPAAWVAFCHLSGLGRIFPRSRLFGQYNYTYLESSQTHEVEAVSGSCMCLRREIIDRVGLMDESFFMFWEDTDYCYRIHQAGYQVVYHPATKIVHYKGESVKTDPLYNLRIFHRALMAFSRKHGSFAGNLFSRALLRIIISLRIGLAYLRNSIATFSSMFIDTAVIGLAFFAMICVRFLPDPHIRTRDMLILYAPVVGVYVLLWLGAGALFQIYGRYVLSYSRALVASLVGFLIIATLTYLYRDVAYSRLVLVSASALVAALLPGWRLVIHLRRVTHKVGDSYRARRPSIFSRRAAILGAGQEGPRIANLLLRRPDTGIDLLGFIDDQPFSGGDEQESVLPWLGRVDELHELASQHRFQEVIVAGANFTNQQLMGILEQTKDLPLLFRIVPHEDEVMLGKANVEYIGDLPFVNIEATLYRRFHLLSKRLFDLFASLFMLVLLVPVWPFLLPGIQRHVIWGVNGEHVTIWIHGNGEGLRRLPLLWSIFKGDMSFVGSEITTVEEPDPGLLFKPGMTGLAQLRRIADEPEIAVSYEHYYLQHQSLTFDLEILLKALFRI